MRGCLQFINILYWIGRYRIPASNMVAKRVYQSSKMLTESTAVVEFNCQRICIPRNHEKETHEKVHSYLPDFWILVMHTSRIKPLLKRVHMLKNIVLGRSKQTIFFYMQTFKNPFLWRFLFKGKISFSDHCPYALLFLYNCY